MQIILSAQEVANILGVKDIASVYELLRNKRLRGFKLGKHNSDWKIFSDDLENFIEKEYNRKSPGRKKKVAS